MVTISGVYPAAGCVVVTRTEANTSAGVSSISHVVSIRMVRMLLVTVPGPASATRYNSGHSFCAEDLRSPRQPPSAR